MMEAIARATPVLKEGISANIQKQFLHHQNEMTPLQQGSSRRNRNRRRNERGKQMIFQNGAVKDQSYTQPKFSHTPF
jgi:hypothetical protein